MPNLSVIVERLETLFNEVNIHLFNAYLEKPVITVSPDTTKNSYGWCTLQKVWKEKDDNNSERGYYEINVCAEYLNRPFAEIIETLLHEMCHLFSLQNGVKDCSRNNTYHNKYFKQVAEAHGLIVEYDKKYGFYNTKLNNDNMLVGQKQTYLKDLV